MDDHHRRPKTIRYKFVIDRAKKLLENTDLVSLRRAVDVDIHPPTTAEANVNLAAHEAAGGGKGGLLLPAGNQSHHHHLAGHNCGDVGGGGDGCVGGVSGPTTEDCWDQFVVPLSARRRISGHTAYGGNLFGAPRATGGGGVVAFPPQRNGGGERGSLGVKNENFKSFLPGESTRTRERRALSLSQLSISSKTVAFPRGHVPSVMGAKGHGKKRGRINHFAMPTPPSFSGEDDDDDSKANCLRDHGGTSTVAHGLNSITSGWSLPHELDPTSTVTSLVGTTTKKRETSRTANNNNNNCSIQTASASRVSTCDTINSPSRVAAIMMGVASGVHKALPPPCINSSDGVGGPLKYSGFFSPRGSDISPAAYSSDVDASICSLGNSSGRGVGGCARQARQQTLLPAGKSSSGGCFADGGVWPGGVLPQRLTESGSGAMVMSGGGHSSTSGVAAGHDRTYFSGIDGYAFPPAVGVGGNDTGGGDGGGGCNRRNNTAVDHALPLLHRVPRTGARDDSLLSLAGVKCDVDSGGAAATLPAPLSNDSTMGRWKNDDDGNSSVSTTGVVGGDGARAGNDVGNNTPVEETSSEIQATPQSPALVVSPDQPLAGTTAFTVAPAEEAGGGGGGGVGCRKECDTPATWGSDDHLGIVSARSDPPPTRGKSALRGWSVPRAVAACSPLATTKRTAPSTKR